nr:type IV secretory system conjugative DNA transfer family protein [uncultured Butyrivibrio sp.]
MATQIQKERRRKATNKIYMIAGGVAWFYGLLAYLHAGFIMSMNPRMNFVEAINMGLTNVITHPLEIFPLNGSSLFNFILFSIVGFMLLFMWHTSQSLKKHDNPDTVNGEAHLMNIEELEAYNKKFAAPLGSPEINGENNMIISKDIRLAIDNRGTRRNCNILVIGGSGAGKSRFFAAPNILQYNCNFVITDPSGEMLRDYGKALEDQGYEVKVFNLTDTYRSNRYNPFHYIKSEKDVFTLVNTLIKNTNPSEGKAGDPFWENSEKLLLTALILYLWHTQPEEKQTFSEVVRLLTLAQIDENDATAKSELDRLFEELERNDTEKIASLAVRQYKKFKMGAGKTLKSILISVGVRLQTFELSDIQYLTDADDFEFERFSDTKQAIFVIIPTADTTFNFIVSLLYSQLFSSLYNYAETRAEYGWRACIDKWTNIRVEQAYSKEESKDAKKRLEDFVEEIKAGVKIKPDKEKKLYRVYTKKSGKLVGWRGTKEETKKFVAQLKNIKIEKCEPKCPNHVRLILDEFANIGQIPDFNEKLATMRKYEISCSIILQALSQLKEIYDKKWNTIVSNCDTKLFLGCDDSETIEWMLKMLGKRTTTVQNMSWNSGKGGGSTSYNKSSIELLTIDQISMMQDDECLVRIRGVRPYYGKKYELTDHPNYAYAKKTEGKFTIPLSKDVKERKQGSLYVLTGGSIAKKLAHEVMGGSPVDSVQKHGTPINDVEMTKNEARKEAAKEAQRDLDDFNEFAPEPEEVALQGLCEAFGIKEGMSDEQIKEQIETLIDLENPPEGEMTFAATA